MVLSLRNICLLHTRNGIVDGSLQANMETISPTVRQQIFKTLSWQQQLGNENCLQFMKHPLFFSEGFSTIDILPTENRYHLETRPATDYQRFFELLLSAVQSVPNLADNITTLRLVVEIDATTPNATEPDIVQEHCPMSTPIHIVLRLIGECTNLKSLCLVISDETQTSESANHLLRDLTEAIRKSGSPGLEQLELQNLTDRSSFQLTFDQQRVFQRLTYLRLQDVVLENDVWKRLMECCRETLESLILERFDPQGVLMASRLDQLKSLTVRQVHTEQLPTDVADYCPKLESFQFEICDNDAILNHLPELELLLSSVSSCSIEVKSEKKMDHELFRRLIDIAGANINKLELVIRKDFTKETVNDVIAGLPNLHSLICSRSFDESCDVLYDQFLNALFRDKVRSENLLELRLPGMMSEQTLELLFSNCAQLRMLSLGCLVDISDYHLQLWTEAGARPSYFRFGGTLTDVGLKTLIKASGPTLRKLQSFQSEPENIDAVADAIVNCCPMLEYICLEGVSERIRNNYTEFGKKFFNAVVVDG